MLKNRPSVSSDTTITNHLVLSRLYIVFYPDLISTSPNTHAPIAFRPRHPYIRPINPLGGG